MIDKDEIVLKPLLDEDIPLFDRWLSKDYIYKWLCPDGEEQREAWLDEVNNRNGKYDDAQALEANPINPIIFPSLSSN